MGKIMSLTDAQRAAMAPHAAAWIARALEVRPSDRARAERGILAHYRLAGLPAPRHIVWTTSPIAVSIAGPIAATLLQHGAVHGAVDDAVHGAVYGAVDGAVRGAVGHAVHGAVSGAVDGAVRGAVGHAVDDAVDGAVRGAVGHAVDDAVDGAVGHAVDDAVSGAVYGAVGHAVDGAVRGAVGHAVDDAVSGAWWRRLGGQFWAAWPAAYGSFFRDVMGLDIAPEALAAAEDVTECGWWWPHRDFVVVCDRPTTLLRDEQGRLHSGAGPAIAWADGWGVYAWHGTRVPREWIEQRAELRPETVLRAVDMEQRRAGCEIIGWDSVLSGLPHRVIDADADPEIGTLIEIDLPDSPGERFVRARCGTGRWIYYGAPPEARTALEACAASYQLQPHEYRPEVRT